MRTIVAVLITGGVCAVSTAAAQDIRPTRTASVATFESLDRNSDHRVSRSEAGYDRRLSETFAYADVDGDGFLSKVEYSTFTEAQARSNLARR